jgi:hypothetical protein
MRRCQGNLPKTNNANLYFKWKDVGRLNGRQTLRTEQVSLAKT